MVEITYNSAELHVFSHSSFSDMCHGESIYTIKIGRLYKSEPSVKHLSVHLHGRKKKREVEIERWISGKGGRERKEE